MQAISLKKSIFAVRNRPSASNSSLSSFGIGNSQKSSAAPSKTRFATSESTNAHYQCLTGSNDDSADGMPAQTAPACLLFDELSFELERGSLVVVRGPSGCGKTTLLRCLAHLDLLDSGRVVLEGVDVFDMSPVEWHSRVAYVPQKTPKFDGSSPFETIKEIAGFRARNIPLLEMQLRVCEAMRELGLDAGSVHDEWNTLSGGEQQRMMHAIAASLDPHVVLLDEPTAALDAQAAAAVENFYLRRRPALITFWVTHSDEQQQRLQPDLIIDFYRRWPRTVL